jgi:hypothetical protein
MKKSIVRMIVVAFLGWQFVIALPVSAQTAPAWRVAGEYRLRYQVPPAHDCAIARQCSDSIFEPILGVFLAQAAEPEPTISYPPDGTTPTLNLMVFLFELFALFVLALTARRVYRNRP